LASYVLVQLFGVRLIWGHHGAKWGNFEKTEILVKILDIFWKFF